MSRRFYLIALVCLHCILLRETALRANPEVPGAPQTKPIALVGGEIHPVSRPTISDGTILFVDGKIAAVGQHVELPAGCIKIDIRGKHVYPGLIDGYNNVGLVEINSIRATKDDVETGEINPNSRAQVAVNPDSEIIPTTRSNGVLVALTGPSGGLLSGRSVLLQLDGWTWEDLTLRSDVALHIHWPSMSPVGDLFYTAPSREQTDARDKALEQLRRTFEQAVTYAKARSAAPDQHPIDQRWESLRPVLDGSLPVIIHADETQQIQAAVAFARQYKLRMILHGGYDAPQCADLLKQYQIPVIVAGTYRLPLRRSDDYDAAYTVPERLRAAGIKYCIASAKGHGASNARNLPYQAANAVAYGLSAEEALKAITLYPAEILGVSDQLGTLDVKKDATLIVTTGDPLETPTQIERAYVQGREVSLNDRHKTLWRKYQQKYSRQK
jgi:imidazolonepropionase-like amidohydrolase